MIPDPGDTFELRPGATWHNGIDDCEVLFLTPRDGDLIYSVRIGGEYLELPAAGVVQKVYADVLDTNPMFAQVMLEEDDLSGVDQSQLEAAIAMRRHILEAETGYRTGQPGPGEVPRDLYDPARIGLTQRKKNKAAELGMSTGSFYALLKRYDGGGRSLKSLLHGNLHIAPAKLDKYSPELVEAVEKYVMAHRQGSRMNKLQWLAKTHNAIRGAGLTPPGDKAIETIITELTRGNSPWQRSKKTQQSKASRISAGTGWTHVDPGEVWQIDCTPCDFHVRAPGAPGWANCWAVAITDVGSGDSTVLLTPEAPNSRALAVALFRRLFPNVPIAGHPLLPGASLPREILIKIVKDLPTISGLSAPEQHLPGRVMMDHGREGENDHFLGLLCRLGVHVVFSRPRTGSDKPHVEALIGLQAIAAQGVPGSKGNNTQNRGEHPELESLLSLHEAQILADAVCQQLRDNPRSGNRHPADSKTHLSPRVINNIALTRGVPTRLPLRVNLLYEFLPVIKATVNNNRVSIKGRLYSSEDGALMKRLTALSAGDESVKSNPLPFRYDPFDPTRVFWREPGTLLCHKLTQVNTVGMFTTPFSELWFAHMRREPLLGKQNSRTQMVRRKADLDTALSRLTQLGLVEAELSREFVKVLHSVPDPTSLPTDADAADAEDGLSTWGWSAETEVGEAGQVWVDGHDGSAGTPANDLDAFTLEELEDESRW